MKNITIFLILMVILIPNSFGREFGNSVDNDYYDYVEARNYDTYNLPRTITPMKEHNETALHHFNTNNHRAKDKNGREIDCRIVGNCQY